WRGMRWRAFRPRRMRRSSRPSHRASCRRLSSAIPQPCFNSGNRMTIAAERHWNTWDSVYPAQMTYLPLGLTVTPCAFAASTGGFTSFPATTPGLTLGRRNIEGSNVGLTLEHAGTTLDWRYDKPDNETLRGEWRATRFGEWALRFWVMLVLRLDPEGDGNLAT